MAPSKKSTKPTPATSAPSTELKTANSLKLRHILNEKQGRSLEALEKLKAGVSFDKVAMEYSEDKAKVGGSLGYMVRQMMVAEFQTQAFTIPVSTVSNPIYKSIKTQHGYHIVMVEDRKN